MSQHSAAARQLAQFIQRATTLSKIAALPTTTTSTSTSVNVNYKVNNVKEHQRSIVVLTGAGCSTESGVPDYRGPHGRYRRADFVPLTYQAFQKDENERRRYWARSLLGYSVMNGVSCNATHMALHALWQASIVGHIITQNVDGLHHLACYGGDGDASESGFYKYTSSPCALTEIHGNIHLVKCMQCNYIFPRVELQRQLRRANEDLYNRYGADKSRLLPDGDYYIDPSIIAQMKLVYCPLCGGWLKPHVVLFGENVSQNVVHVTRRLVSEASGLICMGTSLQVYSAFRYVEIAKRAQVPVAIVNAGLTRGDELADVKINTDSIAQTMTEVQKILLSPSSSEKSNNEQKYEEKEQEEHKYSVRE